MAGDWIKMRVDLPEDPAVIAIAAAVNIEEDSVVGKLLRCWRWFSGHTRDGNAHGVTSAWLDRYIGVSGWASRVLCGTIFKLTGPDRRKMRTLKRLP